MKLKSLSILAVAICGLVSLPSCKDNWDPNGVEETKTGELSLNSMGVQVDNVEKVIESKGRTTIDLSNYKIKITNTATGSLAHSSTYSEMAGVITLPVGNYRIDVESHTPAKAEWDAPYFIGSKEVSITADEITEIGVVTCNFASLKVSIRFTERLRAQMGEDVQVTVVANDEGRLVYTPEEKRAGYFATIPGSNTLAVHFEGSISGQSYRSDNAYTDVAAGQHRIITYDLKTAEPTPTDESGNVNPGGIDIDISVEDEYLTGNVDDPDEDLGSADRPNQGGENPGGGQDPGTGGGGGDEPQADVITMTSETLSFDQPNQVSPTLQGIVQIHSDAGIKNFVVKIQTDSQQFEQSVSELLPLEFDLAYPGDRAADFESLGFPTGDNVIGAKDLTFDITTFIPLLGAFPGTHKFTLSITDANNIQATKTLTFKS